MVTKRETSCDKLFLAQILADNPKTDVDRVGEAAFPRFWDSYVNMNYFLWGANADL